MTEQSRLTEVAGWAVAGPSSALRCPLSRPRWRSDAALISGASVISARASGGCLLLTKPGAVERLAYFGVGADHGY